MLLQLGHHISKAFEGPRVFSEGLKFVVVECHIPILVYVRVDNFEVILGNLEAEVLKHDEDFCQVEGF